MMKDDDKNDKSIKFSGRFWIDRNAHVFLGPGRIELLEKIDSGSSIAEAARQLGMGYKTAWDMLNAMNSQAEEPLVIRTKGGRHGGGTVLTEHGKKMIVTYRLIESEYYAMLLSLEQRYPDLSQWQKLKPRLQLRTSARNQLSCKIQALEKYGHRILATLDLGEKQHLQALLTQTSVDEMGLSVGRQVIALMKAPLISISAQPSAEESQLLEGVLQHIDEDDAGGAEVEILLKSGQTLIAVLDDAHVLPALESRVYAVIDPKQVILATF